MHTYRKIPNVSPGLIEVFKHFLGGLYSGGAYIQGGLYSGFYGILKQVKKSKVKVSQKEERTTYFCHFVGSANCKIYVFSFCTRVAYLKMSFSSIIYQIKALSNSG